MIILLTIVFIAVLSFMWWGWADDVCKEKESLDRLDAVISNLRLERAGQREEINQQRDRINELESIIASSEGLMQEYDEAFIAVKRLMDKYPEGWPNERDSTL